MPDLLNLAVTGLLSSSVGAVIVGVLFVRHNKTIEAEIQEKLSRALKVFESERTWKEQALFELFGPLQMQFERTKRAFNRWTKKNLYLESKVVREGNETIRNLLLNKGHLIPPELMNEACSLVEHYDAWLEKFDRIRGDGGTVSTESFVFSGPDGYPFPTSAEAKFKETFRRLQHELYGVV
ncbi:hypothetical protein [Uliginosibacterium sp. TH139]|uniref:hypothetical protein n=1 Tax=Uliginosibacterium sp. TH139 TaxID=2067453 RepID=UPI000C7E09C2|nr:hypothetical protein [Uliginosibacterium sp. TH139]PLK46949.1 hypothetical protein C0V76_19290 [Uliginosibacterium sp. TH139]